MFVIWAFSKQIYEILHSIPFTLGPKDENRLRAKIERIGP